MDVVITSHLTWVGCSTTRLQMGEGLFREISEELFREQDPSSRHYRQHVLRMRYRHFLRSLSLHYVYVTYIQEYLKMINFRVTIFEINDSGRLVPVSQESVTEYDLT